MLPCWIFGIIGNLIAFILWYYSRTCESHRTEREGINITLFALWVIITFIPFFNIILSAFLLAVMCMKIGHEWDMVGPNLPKWMHKEIK